MIPYEELCAALDRYAAHDGDASEQSPSSIAGGPAPAAADSAPLDLDGDGRPQQRAAPSAESEGQPIYDDRSNELDIGDVLSDEEAPKS